MTDAGRTIAEGMKVFAADGKSVGIVVRTAEECFEVEYGFVFPRHNLVEASEVVALDERGIHLRQARSELLAGWQRVEQQGDQHLANRKTVPHADEGLLPARLAPPPAPHRVAEEPQGEPPLPPDTIDFGEDRDSLRPGYRDSDDAGPDEDPFGPAPSADGDRSLFQEKLPPLS